MDELQTSQLKNLVEVEKEAVVRLAGDQALKREIELVSINSDREVTRMVQMYKEQNAVVMERLTRIEGLVGGNSAQIRAVEESLRLRDAQLDAAAKTLTVGWKITWGVISVLVATFVWIAVQVPSILRAIQVVGGL
jgi:hypothetical protein